MSTRHHRAVDRYRAGNIEAATIIIADPVKYPPDSLLGEWAALVLQRAKGDGRRLETGSGKVEAMRNFGEAA